MIADHLALEVAPHRSLHDSRRGDWSFQCAACSPRSPRSPSPVRPPRSSLPCRSG